MEGWQPYADKVIAALEQYTPEAWQAMVAYKQISGVSGAIGGLAIGTGFFLVGLSLVRKSHRESEEMYAVLSVFPFLFSMIAVIIGLCCVPSALNPEGAVLLDVLGGVR